MFETPCTHPLWGAPSFPLLTAHQPPWPVPGDTPLSWPRVPGTVTHGPLRTHSLPAGLQAQVASLLLRSGSSGDPSSSVSSVLKAEPEDSSEPQFLVAFWIIQRIGEAGFGENVLSRRQQRRTWENSRCEPCALPRLLLSRLMKKRRLITPRRRVTQKGTAKHRRGKPGPWGA